MSRDEGFDRPSGAELGGLDKFLSNMVAVVLLGLFTFFCCPLVGGILGLIGVFTCKNPDSKRNATILLVIAIVAVVLNIILSATGIVDTTKMMKDFGK